MFDAHTLEGWIAQRDQIRAALWGLLGDLPPIFTPQPEIIERTARDGFHIEKFTFDNGAGATVYGYVLIPAGITTPAPAVLFHHFHAGRYDVGKDELFLEREGVPALGPALAAAGYVVLAIDAYAFGERQSQGPAGDREVGRDTEWALFKRFLWEGRTLWGMIVRDDLLALRYLCSRPDVDTTRIVSTGMSMGASRTTWVSALDERVTLTIPVAQMTRYEDFAAAGLMNGHSIYYYVPGVLRSAMDMEHIVSLTAPRAQLVLIGDKDPLSPVKGVRKVQAYAKQVYKLYDASAQFEMIVYRGVEHAYTPTMGEALFAGLQHFV